MLFHISQSDCFLFARDIRDLSMIPEACQTYNSCLGCVSKVYSLRTVKLKLSTAKF